MGDLVRINFQNKAKEQRIVLEGRDRLCRDNLMLIFEFYCKNNSPYCEDKLLEILVKLLNTEK